MGHYLEATRSLFISWELEREDADKIAYHTMWGSKIWLWEGETLSPLHLLFFSSLFVLFLSRLPHWLSAFFFYTDFSFKDDY